MINPKIETELGKIDVINKEKIIENLEGFVSKYKNIVVTDGDETLLKEAKKQRAEINKVRKAIDEYRLSEQRKYQEPLEKFNEDMKEIKGIADNAWGELDKSVKAVETAQKEAKKAIIDELLLEHGNGYELPFKDSWLNKSTKESEIIEDIKFFAHEAKLQAELREKAKATIVKTCETNKLTPDGYIQLLETGASDVLSIIEMITEAAEQKRQQEEYNAEVERMKQAQIEPEPELTEPTKEEIIDDAKHRLNDPFETGELITNVIEVTATMTQLKALNDFMVSNEIQVKAYEG